MRWCPLIALAFVACDRNPGDDTGDDDVVLTDPMDDLEGAKEQCDGYTDSVTGDFTPVAGATGYFVGDFRFVADGEVEGWEYWVLFSNETWEETGEGWDCHIAWEIFGFVNDEPSMCDTCDYGISFDAYASEDESDCYYELFQYEGIDFSNDYDVRVGQNGEATTYFMFDGSVTELGTGLSNSEGFTYASDPMCKFF